MGPALRAITVLKGLGQVLQLTTRLAENAHQDLNVPLDLLSRAYVVLDFIVIFLEPPCVNRVLPGFSARMSG